MNNAVSKVIFNSDTLIDLTQDTVSPEKLLSGVTAHNSAGEQIVGTYDPNAKVRPAFTNIYSASTRVYPYTIGTSSSLTPFASQSYLKSEHIASGTSINSEHYYFQAMYYEMDGSATATLTLSSDKTFVTPTGTSTLSGSGWAYCCGKSMSVNSTQFGILSSNCTGNGTITYLYCIDLTALVDAGTITSTDINDAIDFFGELPLVPGEDYGGSSGSSSGGIDTSDATATAATILSGKTAYIKGSKVTGTCTYDATTSDATASASDIASGKTAYVKGVKITGTATSSGGSSGLPSTITAGDTPVMASFTGSKITATTATATNLFLSISKAGTYRFYVSASMTSSYGMSSPTVYLYKNGTSAGSTSITSTTYSAVSFDVTCAAGDTIKVYAAGAGSAWSSVGVTVMSLVACIDWDNGL